MSDKEIERARAGAKKRAAGSGAEFVQEGRFLFHRTALGLAPKGHADVGAMGRAGADAELRERVKQRMSETTAEIAFFGHMVANRRALGLPTRGAARPGRPAATSLDRVAARGGSPAPARPAGKASPFAHLLKGAQDRLRAAMRAGRRGARSESRLEEPAPQSFGERAAAALAKATGENEAPDAGSSAGRTVRTAGKAPRD